jgi:DNA invertase Pin-like site-specific DNA recombinase
MSAEQTTKAVGYIRVASGSQRRRERSIYIQRQEILGYARLHAIRIGRFFADHDCVEDIELRQGLSDAMAFAAKGKAQAVVVAGLDRLSSSVEEVVRFTERHRLLIDGPALVSVRDRLDTRTAEGRLALAVTKTVTRWEHEAHRRGA